MRTQLFVLLALVAAIAHVDAARHLDQDCDSTATQPGQKCDADEGLECNTTLDPVSNDPLSGFNGRCAVIGGVCSNNDDCDPQICEDGQCVDPPAACVPACEGDQVCDDGTCVDPEPEPDCEKDKDCKYGKEFCKKEDGETEGFCTEKGDKGDACEKDKECKSGNCKKDKCAKKKSKKNKKKNKYGKKNNYGKKAKKSKKSKFGGYGKKNSYGKKKGGHEDYNSKRGNKYGKKSNKKSHSNNKYGKKNNYGKKRY